MREIKFRIWDLINKDSPNPYNEKEEEK